MDFWRFLVRNKANDVVATLGEPSPSLIPPNWLLWEWWQKIQGILCFCLLLLLCYWAFQNIKGFSQLGFSGVRAAPALVILCWLSPMSMCDESLPALNRLDYWSGRQRTPHRDRDCLGNDPQWVPGSLSCCSWLFPEQLRSKSEFVGSEEIHQV